jgi:hypothetical protein
MNSLICPISAEKINKNVVRINGLLVVLSVLLYVLTGSLWIMVILFADFLIRGFTSIKSSPYSYVAKKLNQILDLKPFMIDKAPKLFASRVGFLFATASIGLYFINPLASLAVASVLMFFAFLEAAFDFCVGCLVYTYVVLPLNR